jgi:hypothetical protein
MLKKTYFSISIFYFLIFLLISCSENDLSTPTQHELTSSVNQNPVSATSDAISVSKTKEITTSSISQQIISQACLITQLPAKEETSWNTKLFTWSPDSRYLVYIIPENSQTGLLNLVSSPLFSSPKQLSTSVVGDVSLSPDATQIAYVTLRSDNVETVMTINVNGTDMRDWFPGDTAQTDPGGGTKHIIGWIDNSNLLLETHCGTGCKQLLKLYLRDGSLETILFQDEDKHDIWGSDYIISPDQSHVVLVSGGDLQIGISSISSHTVSWISGEYGGQVKTIFANWSPDSSAFLYLRFILGKDSIPLHQPELWVWDVASTKGYRLLPDAITASWSKSSNQIAFLSFGQTTIGSDGSWQEIIATLDGPNLLTLGLYDIKQKKIITSLSIGKVDFGYHWPSQTQQQLIEPVWSPNNEYLAYRDGSGNAWIITISNLTQYMLEIKGDSISSMKWSSNSSMLAISTINRLLIYKNLCSP